MASSTHDTGAGRGETLGSATRILALISGIVFTVVGIAGFIITGLDFSNFAAHMTNHTLLGFMINPLHNLVHLALGILGLVMWRTTRAALAYGYIVLIGYAGAFVYGLFALDKTWDFLSINAADNVLHLGLAVLGLVIVVLGHTALSGETVEGRTRFEAPGRGGYGARA